MTVSTQTVEYDYDGDGVSVAFSFPGRVDSPADVHGAVVGADGVLSFPLYSVAADEEGATVTFLEAPAVGERVYVWRETPRDQKVDYGAGDFPSATHEQNADRLVLMVQERKDAEKRVWRMNRGGKPIAEMNPVLFAERLVGVGPDNQPIPSGRTMSEIDNAASVVSRALAEQGLARGADLDLGLITSSPEATEDWGSIL